MIEFLQSYGIWIFFGLLFSLMLWRRTRGHGMGCCGVHQQVKGKVHHPESEKHSSGCH